MEQQQTVVRRHKTIRGNAYTLEEFATRYNLRHKEAADLFKRFGPSSVELDLLMKAKQRSAHVFDISV